MERYEEIFNELRSQGMRITPQRREILNILQGRHLTFKEIRSELKRRGYTNLATVYNNIDFLLQHELIIELHIEGKRYFDLAIEASSHDAKSHIHTLCQRSNTIIEINDSSIFELIQDHPQFKQFDIQKIQIVINGYCHYQNEDTCGTSDELCYFKQAD
jgi:Fur family ferric uptake transcriptional regulator/Fur family peroxide stress response transcriptional regulator